MKKLIVFLLCALFCGCSANEDYPKVYAVVKFNDKSIDTLYIPSRYFINDKGDLQVLNNSWGSYMTVGRNINLVKEIKP